MPQEKLVIKTQTDTAFPRDAVIVTANFNVVGPAPDLDALCGDMANLWLSEWCTLGSPEVEVKAYDNEGTKPVFPNGYAVRNEGSIVGGGNVPREVALCLSYYSERNVARRRGRMYLPVYLSESSVQKSPPTTLQQKALDLADALAGLGGVNVDWVVWSDVDGAGRSVSKAWCDNEWDAQRRRGLRATARQERNVGP